MRALRPALWVGLARVLTSFVCLLSGFRAISDDDYSRVVIAARFAEHPTLDPSGTSWLPLPFWLYGAPMAVLGDSLLTARAVAICLGAAGAVLVWVAARVLGLSERAALCGALAAVALPYGAWLSAATVPEAPTAALLLVGVASLVRSEAKVRAWGGVALGAACFCRYEAWAPATVFALLTCVDAVRGRRPELWLAVAFASSPMLLWLLHGVVRHGDALFFVARVQQYRAALGSAPQSWTLALLRAPLAIVRSEPELCALTSVALGFSLSGRTSPFGSSAWRPVAALGALVALLVAADATGSSATHHAERSLLPVFWFLALLSAGLFVRLAETPGRGWSVPAWALPLALAAGLLLRTDVSKTFVDRRDEELVGEVLRRLDARGVGLDTDDFGFFAMQAALGAGRSFPVSDHDPRKPTRARLNSAPALAAVLLQNHAQWLVTTEQRAKLSEAFGKVRLRTPGFRVVELDPRLMAQQR